MINVDFSNKTRLRKLLWGDGIAVFGGWIDYIAILTISVYKLNTGPFEIALIGAATLLPGIILAGPIGSLVNGQDAMKWLRISLLIRAIFTMALLFADNMLLFVSIAVFRAAANSVAVPAISAISAKSIPEEKRTRYYSILNTLNSAAKITAPTLGGATGAFLGEEYVLLMSGILTLISFGVFCFIPSRKNEIQNNSQKPESIANSTLNHLAWYMYANVTLVYFGMVFMVNNQLPVILSMNDLDKSALGLIVSASAIGNFLCGLWSTKQAKTKPLIGSLKEILIPGLISMGFFIGFGTYIGLTSAMRVEPMAALFFLIGIFSARFAISSNVFMATNFRNHIGIVAGKLQAIQNAAMLIAPFIGAVVLKNFSASTLFLASGFIGALGLSGLFIYSSNTCRNPPRQTLLKIKL